MLHLATGRGLAFCYSGSSSRLIKPVLVTALSAILFALMLPGVASATSTTLDLTDAGGSGLGATLTIDDMLEPGSLSVTLSSTGATSDVRWFVLGFSDENLPPLVVANGQDVFSSTFYSLVRKGEDAPCPCRLSVDLGGVGPFEPTGLQTTSFVISHPTVSLSLAGIEDETFYVVIGRDWMNDSSSFIKFTGKIPVIPEPSTSVLMLLGLAGLSLSSQRLASRRPI